MAPQLLATVITVSDEVAAATDSERGAPVAEELLTRLGVGVERAVVPDDEDALEAAIRAAITAGSRFVMTCGGTGIGPKDRSPETVRRLLSFEIPGIAEEIRRIGIAHAKPALVSREVAGVIIPDHTPQMTCGAPWHAGMAFALGYMRAAVQMVVEGR